MLKTAIASGLLLAATGGSIAAPMTARDGAGTVYQLNEDGTYGIIVKGENGETYVLSPDGRWSGADAATDLVQRFDAFLENALSGPTAPNLVEGEWPKYKACLIAAFKALPIAAQQIIVSGDDPRDVFKQLQAVDPQSAAALDAADRACRKTVQFVQ